MKNLLLNWSPVIICCLAIFYLSTQPVQSPVTIDNIDLVAHAACYALFAFLFARALQLSIKARKTLLSGVVVVSVSTYGGLMEWYQAYLPTRTSSLADGVANLIGALLGIFAYLIYQKFYGKQEKT